MNQSLQNIIEKYDDKGMGSEYRIAIENVVSNAISKNEPLNFIVFTCSTINSEYLWSDTPWLYVNTDPSGNNLEADLPRIAEIMRTIKSVYPAAQLKILIGNTDPYYIYLQQFKNFPRERREELLRQFNSRWENYRKNFEQWIQSNAPDLNPEIISWYPLEKSIERRTGASFELEYETTKKSIASYFMRARYSNDSGRSIGYYMPMDGATFDQIFNLAKDNENAGRYFHAAHLYKEALEMARKANDSEKITLLKKKLVEMNQKSESEMQTFSSEQEIPREEIEGFINHVIGERQLPEILNVIGRHRRLCPDIEELMKTAQRNQPVSFVFANLSTISKDGHTIKGGSDADHAWQMQIYGFAQGLVLQVYLPNLFHELIRKRNMLTKDNLAEYFKNSGLFSENQLKIIEVGIERYFAEDYVSAMHILIPQFEGVFLSLSAALGLDVIALDRGTEISTQPRTLSSSQLDSEPFQKAWTKDFCEQIKFVLFEPLGYKFRHKVAHGEILAGECNFATATLIVYLFLVVAARVKKK